MAPNIFIVSFQINRILDQDDRTLRIAVATRYPNFLFLYFDLIV